MGISPLPNDANDYGIIVPMLLMTNEVLETRIGEIIVDRTDAIPAFMELII